jgi:hypothetical protein
LELAAFNRGVLMPETIEFQSRVGSDGVLDLHVPLGEMGAGAVVIVTIRRFGIRPTTPVTDPVDWHRIANETYGSCAGLGLERPPQGQFEIREEIE